MARLRSFKTPSTETEIQASIIQLLKVFGFFVWRNQAIPVRGRKALEATIGTPDVLCVIGGRLFAIEVKKPGEGLSPAQEVWRDNLLHAGALWMMATSNEEVERFLKENKLI